MSDNQEVALFGEKTDELPSHLQDNDVGNLGNENTSQRDFAMPQLKLLQALSPECRSVDGAREGKLYNSVTQEVFDWVFAINLYFTKEFAIFKKRAKGGGFFGNFDNEEEAKAELDNLDGDASDYDIVETDKHTLMLLDEEGKPTGPATIFMSNTKLSVSRTWNTAISQKSQGKPRFSRIWRISSRTDRNKRGDEYANFVIDDCGWAPAEQFGIAMESYKAISGENSQAA